MTLFLYSHILFNKKRYFILFHFKNLLLFISSINFFGLNRYVYGMYYSSPEIITGSLCTYMIISFFIFSVCSWSNSISYLIKAPDSNISYIGLSFKSSDLIVIYVILLRP